MITKIIGIDDDDTANTVHVEYPKVAKDGCLPIKDFVYTVLICSPSHYEEGINLKQLIGE